MTNEILNQNIFECLKLIEKKFDQVKTIEDNVYNCLIRPLAAITEIDNILKEIYNYIKPNMAYPYLELYFEDINDRIIDIREKIKKF